VVLEAVKSEDEQVKLAAIEALGALGSRKEDVTTLVAMLSSDSQAVLQVAENALLTIEGEAVNAALTDAIAGASSPVYAKLVSLLANRRAGEAIPEALKALKKEDAAVRTAALKALALLGGPEEAPAVIEVIAGTTDPPERAAAQTTLNAIAVRKGDEILPVVLEAMSGADDAVRLVLLQTAAEIGSARALEAVLAAMKDGNPEISGEAVRMLSNWATLDAAAHLEALAKSEDLTKYVLGLRGYVRLAREEAQGGQKLTMLQQALALARRPEEMKLVLGAWGGLMHAGALRTLQPYLDEPEVRNEAALAIIGIAGRVNKQNENQKNLAVEVLEAVLAKCADQSIRDNAQKVLDGLK
jgi:hypothetical protein